MNNTIKYTFKLVDKCDFCGSPASLFKTLGKRLNKKQGLFPHKSIGITTTIQQCKNCELIFSNPQPIPNSIADHYAISPDAFWPKSYFEVDENYFLNEINQLKTLQPNNENEELSALDIGAGIGKCLIALEKIGYKSYGIEPSETFYNMAIDEMKIDSNRLTCSSIEDAIYPENTFDFITFGAVLEHLYNPGEAIEKALKWLKKDGLIHIEVPSSKWLISRMINKFYKLTNTGYCGNISPMHSPYHLYEFSKKSFEIHGKKNGYEIAKLDYHVCNTYAPKFLNPILVPLMKSTNTGMQLTIWLKKI